MASNIIQYDRDDRRKKKFLKHLAISSNVTASAQAAGIANSTLYLWRSRDPTFREDWMKALATGYELLETELLQRAREGIEKPVFHAGNMIAMIRDYDNGLAFRLLMAHRDMAAKMRVLAEEATDNEDRLRHMLAERIRNMQSRLQCRRQDSSEDNE